MWRDTSLYIQRATVVVFSVRAFSQPLIYSPWVARALGESGVSSLAIKVLARNATGVGLNPTWSHLSQRSGCFKENLFPYTLSNVYGELRTNKHAQ